jgi:hypothetical protein
MDAKERKFMKQAGVIKMDRYIKFVDIVDQSGKLFDTPFIFLIL